MFEAKFSTFGIILEISRQKPSISFIPHDSIKDLLRLNASTIYEQINLSPILVDILSFDNFPWKLSLRALF